MYGLVDGPLLWQLAFLHFMVTDLGFHKSLHDDNFLYRCDSSWQVAMIIVVHVDDVLLAACKYWIEWYIHAVEGRFGKVKRHGLPFTYLGIRHERLADDHVFLHQQEYLSKLKPAVHRKGIADSSSLDTAEHFAFRSLVCSFLWMCLTRLDIAHECVALQTEMVTPLLCHLKQANSMLQRARRNVAFNGLHFRKLGFPVRLQTISDSGHTTKRTVYPFQGRLVLLMRDHASLTSGAEYFSWRAANIIGGYGHPLYFSASKAQKVSHSTSHSETNAMVSTVGVAQVICNRFTELDFAAWDWYAPSAKDLLWMSDRDILTIPCDSAIDAMNVFELILEVIGCPPQC